MDLKKHMPEDAATWAQAIFMALPVLVYGFVYWHRYAKYSFLGISKELISVRFEDVLFLIVAAMAMLWVFSGWVFEVLDSGNKRETLISLCLFSLSLLFAAEALFLITILVRTGRADPSQLLLLLFQGLSLYLMAKARWSWFTCQHVDQNRRFLVLLITGIAMCFLASQLLPTLVFHLSKYQICEQDHALVAGFDSQGRAIEKAILNIDDNGVCTLSEGYALADVTGKELREERFTYIEVAAESDAAVQGAVSVAGPERSSNW